ncbi:MAG: hypothetical protein KFF73_04225, partial [Cyclobacteriaceae bacterium]|nr:hypothetical protein [Cyclobacteriaceae bacterium]
RCLGSNLIRDVFSDSILLIVIGLSFIKNVLRYYKFKINRMVSKGMMIIVLMFLSTPDIPIINSKKKFLTYYAQLFEWLFWQTRVLLYFWQVTK